MTVDVEQILRSAIRSGRFFYGARQALNAIRIGRAVAVVVAISCSDTILKEIVKISNISSIPVFLYKGTAQELGTALHRRFPISVVAIREIPETELALAVKGSLKSNAQN
ncbi:MAG: ribosomal L7Ae/L30e/S12e/Gadd45 family protein [Candidatus Bathyarchaeia archaeon]